jgi:formylglycine-generating enzyme
VCTAPAITAERVYIDGFFMDKTDVRDAQFARFVAATGYVTVAEKVPSRAGFPGAPPENLFAGSIVLARPIMRSALDDNNEWWSYVKGANWRHPTGTRVP